jgi:CRISPR-associated protein Cas2
MEISRSLVVIAYDTPSNKRRRRLVRLALDMSDRVQKSVFEGNLTEVQRHLLWNRLVAAANQEEDSLRLYSLCERCQGQSQRIGVVFAASPSDCWLL